MFNIAIAYMPTRQITGATTLPNICSLLPSGSVEVQAEHITIPIDRAVPAGLAVNEFVTNDWMPRAWKQSGS
jgi:two-component sensor histidine kinase